MNNAKRLLSLSRAVHNQVARNVATDVGPRTARLKELQKRLQIDDGVPVHLKGGLGDKLLYNLTVVLTVIGVGMSFDTLYRIITGKK